MAFRSDSKPGDLQLTGDEISQGKDTKEWFDKIETIPAPIKAVLESYSSLDEDQIIPYVKGIVSMPQSCLSTVAVLTLCQRARAFQKWPYPCIGQLRFLDLNLSKHTHYSEVVSRLKIGQTYLDAGCCFGQDLRKLIFDGAPSSKALYGLDIESAFLDLGYELFRDRATFQDTLLTVDLLKQSQPVLELEHSIDIIGTFSLFHFFRYEQQIKVAKRFVRFAKTYPSSTLVGRQLGAPKGDHYSGLLKDTTISVHDIGTFTTFWERIGEETASQWEVDANMTPVEAKLANQSWAFEGMSWLWFRVTRL